MKNYFKYSVEMFLDKQWKTEIRYYQNIKDLNDFDLKDIPNLRKNAQLIL